jgi:leader peptidase (prepilin peptidase) / N-methyltransferase
MVLLIALLGLLVGSFLNVVIYRLPRGKSLVGASSHCPSCATALKPWHNVPLVSWFALRGRCAYCKAPISVRYPLVESATALLFVAITWRFGISAQLPAYLYLAAIGIAVVMIDFDVRILPDAIILPSYVVGTLLLTPTGAAGAGWWTVERALAGMVGLLALFFCLALAYPTFIQFGDARLAGLVGLYLGWMSWTALMLGTAAALVIALFGAKTAALATGRREAGSAAVIVPVGVCLVVGAVVMLFVAAPVAGWHVGPLG